MGKSSADPVVKAEWAKHLRPYGKSRFARQVRRKIKEELNGNVRIQNGKSKKDTKRWCKGKVGREHRYQTFPWPIGTHIDKAWYVVDVCQGCGKHSKWSRYAPSSK